MSQNVSRRRFLTGAAGTAVGVIGFPYLISSSALGNPETEEIIGDPVATAMLGRSYRNPWHL